MSWMVVWHIAGGVALILFGVRFLRKGLDRLFGARLGLWIERLAANPIRAFFTGIGVSVAASSSTTLSALAVQTLDRGHVRARQMLAVMFGVNIGMTTLALLGSFSITQYYPLMIAIGVALFQFTRIQRWRGIGQTILALGFIFLGITLIQNATAGASPTSDMGKLVTALEQYPVIFTVMAAILTVALQSSTATILMLIGLAGPNGGLVHIGPAVAAVAGANIGVALTLLMIGWHAVEARRLAVGNLMMKVAMAIAVLALLGPITTLLEIAPGTLALRIGCTHTSFNIIVALFGLPLIPVLDRLLCRMIPDRAAEKPFGPIYLTDPPPQSAALALGQSRREILRVSEIARAMLEDLWRGLSQRDESLAKAVSARDDEIDELDKRIKDYLIRLATDGIEGDDAKEQLRQLRYLAELETIGDLLDKNLSELAIKYTRQGLHFSDEGWRELCSFYEKVKENMLIAETAFHTRDRKLATQLLDHKEHINTIYRTLRDRHLARLNAGFSESHDTSAIHLDILTHLKRINSCVSHIAYALLGDQADHKQISLSPTPATPTATPPPAPSRTHPASGA